MKLFSKTVKYIIAPLFALTSLFFTSCHDDIYNMITREVALEDGISGDIRSIVPFKNSLYLTNNNIYKKTAESSNSTGKYNGQWSKQSSPLSDGTVLFLASDASNLYALTTTWEEDEDESEIVEKKRQLWTSSDGSTWSEVSVTYDTSSASNLRILFDNQAQEISGNYVIPSSSRAAYITAYNGSTYITYKLNGTSVTDGKTNSSAYIKAACIGSSTAFTSNYALAAGTDTSSGTNRFYWAQNGSTLYYSAAGATGLTSAGSVDLDHGTIYSIAVTKNYLLLGTSSGIARVALSNGVPAGSTASFGDNNADSLLTSRVPLLYARNSSANEAEDDEYGCMNIYSYISSSNDTFKEIGLYAYYNGRGNWNRDGD